MIINREREKLIHAIIFFATHTNNCGKIKLFKLLYFLDFEHFKKTGRSVTGLTYRAWPKGPVSKELFEEIKEPAEDMAEAMNFSEKFISSDYPPMLEVSPKISFSSKHFSKREMTLLSGLAEEYRNTRADDMIEATHLENMPWDMVYNKQGNPQHIIPYELALRPDELDRMMTIVNDRKELLESLG